MAINFPHPATPDQTHSHNGKTWKWNGTSWSMQSSFTTGGGVNAGGGNVAVGTIALWSGSVSNIPAGWQLCDGTNGSPDLRDKFVIGAGNSYNVGVTGGSKDAIVVQHDHDINDSGHTHRPLSSSNNSTTVMSVEVAVDGSTEKYCPAIGSGATVNNASNTTEETTGISIQDEGSSGVNANLPPYYSLCYIYCNTSGGVPVPSYTDSDVDSHLNQDDPTNGYVLSWNGTDYEWVAQSSGGGGSVYTIEALLSPGIQLLDDGNAAASNRIFFDGGTGVSVTRTNTNPHTIQFKSSFTTLSSKTSSYTLLATDIGKTIKITSPGGGVNLQLTIPDLSASLSFGDEVRIMNGSSDSIDVNASALSHLYWAQSGINSQNGGYTTGNREIAGYALITLTYRGSNEWNIHGDGVF